MDKEKYRSELDEKHQDYYDDVMDRYFSHVVENLRENEAYVMALSIDEKHRHNHLGAALLSYIVEDNSEKAVRLDVLKDNTSAIRLYEACGLKAEEVNGKKTEQKGYAYNDEVPLCYSMVTKRKR